MAKKRFRLSFRTTEIQGADGTIERALMIAVAPTPVKGWLRAMLACEDGSMQEKMISQHDFDLGARKLAVLIEVEDEQAAPIIYGSQLAIG